MTSAKIEILNGMWKKSSERKKGRKEEKERGKIKARMGTKQENADKEQ